MAWLCPVALSGWENPCAVVLFCFPVPPSCWDCHQAGGSGGTAVLAPSFGDNRVGNSPGCSRDVSAGVGRLPKERNSSLECPSQAPVKGVAG